MHFELAPQTSHRAKHQVTELALAERCVRDRWMELQERRIDYEIAKLRARLLRGGAVHG
jgi:hypothetical protein